MQINSLKFNAGSKNTQPCFKGLSNNIDFADKFTSRKASMFLYTGCIISRLVNSRDKYEFKETLTRDSLGWASLFFAAAIFEKTVGLAIETVDKLLNGKDPQKENLFLTKENRLPNIFEALNPFDKKFTLRTFEDIKTINDKALQKSLIQKKSALYLMSLAFSVGVIGMFIPWMNTVTTRKDRQKELNAAKIDKNSSSVQNQ